VVPEPEDEGREHPEAEEARDYPLEPEAQPAAGVRPAPTQGVAQLRRNQREPEGAEPEVRERRAPERQTARPVAHPGRAAIGRARARVEGYGEGGPAGRGQIGQHVRSVVGEVGRAHEEQSAQERERQPDGPEEHPKHGPRGKDREQRRGHVRGDEPHHRARCARSPNRHRG